MGQGVGCFPSEEILPLQKLGLDRTSCGAGSVCPAHNLGDLNHPPFQCSALIPHLGCSHLDILERWLLFLEYSF